MKKIKSLIVEDNSIAQKLIQNMLKDFGSCDTADDGLQGWEKVKNAVSEHRHYDLICLDIQMPKKDGIELLEEIRKLERKSNGVKKSIIIMVTALSDEEIIRKCVKLGCSSFLVKPVEKENLTKILRRHKLF